jgi:hypothetical protein
MKYLVILLFSLVLLLRCNQSTSLNSYVRLIRPTRGVPLVLGYINGKPAWFLLDTGASHSILDLDQLLRYGMYTDTVSLGEFIGIGGKSNIYIPAGLTDFQLGEKFYTVPFTSTDLSGAITNLQTFQGIRVFGILGSDFINKYGCSINYRLNVLTLTRQ